MILLGILVLFGAYLVVIFGGAPLVERILKFFAVSQGEQSDEGLPGAGRLVGMLERGIILTFSFFGNFAAVSFVFLAKSMARFRQLENRQFAEYYLIGTLLSFFFAIIVAIVTQAIFAIFQLPRLLEESSDWVIFSV